MSLRPFPLLGHRVRISVRMALIAATIALVAAACGSEQTVSTGSASVPGASVADAGASLGAISTANGDSFQFADLDNKPTVVWFWGPG